MLTWAFEFEDQPYFDGFRTLATNGIDKPVLNFFRMAGMMRGDRVKVESSDAVGRRRNCSAMVCAAPPMWMRWPSARIARCRCWSGTTMTTMSRRPRPPLTVHIAGLPDGRAPACVTTASTSTHSNAWTAWKKMGSPQKPTAEQYAALEAAGQLEELTSPQWISVTHGAAVIQFDLPRQGLSLLNLTF